MEFALSQQLSVFLDFVMRSLGLGSKRRMLRSRRQRNQCGRVRGIVWVEVDQATTGGDLARLLTEGF